MNQREAFEAEAQGPFVRYAKHNGFFHPDRLIDRNVLTLAGVTHRPARTEEEILKQLADTPLWADFVDNTPAVDPGEEQPDAPGPKI